MNGVCLTVAEFAPALGQARFFLSSETVARSNLGRAEAGDLVNLERAVTLNTRLSGHLVQGHVDGLALLHSAHEVPSSEGGESSHEVTFDLPTGAAPYLIDKGSIALDGVSLTVNRREVRPEAVRITIMLVPHTWRHTRLSCIRPGEPVNYELDQIAKYVANWVGHA